MKRTLLCFSVFCNLILIIAFIIFIQKLGGLNYLLTKIKYRDSAVYIHKTSQFKILKDIDNEIIFLGNSLINQGNWNELINCRCLNRGIVGDGMTGTFKRLGEIISRKPAKIFIMLGLNDLIVKKDLDQIINEYSDIIEKIYNECPNTRIYLQSILPVNNSLKNQKVKQNDIIRLNERIRTLADEHKLVFIDLYPLFLNSHKELDLRYSSDGVHLNGEAYLIWTDAIQKYINE